MPYTPTLHGPHRIVGPNFHASVFAIVRTIPRGRVTTYGDIAAALGLRTVARHVGFALAAAPPDLPWHRVVNSRGTLSPRADSQPSAEQRRRLRREGITIDSRHRITDFSRLRVTDLPRP